LELYQIRYFNAGFRARCFQSPTLRARMHVQASALPIVDRIRRFLENARSTTALPAPIRTDPTFMIGVRCSLRDSETAGVVLAALIMPGASARAAT